MKPSKLQAKYLALLNSNKGKTVCIQGINHKHYRTLQILAERFGVKWSLCGNTWLSFGDVDTTEKASCRYKIPIVKVSWDSGLPSFDELTREHN